MKRAAHAIAREPSCYLLHSLKISQVFVSKISKNASYFSKMYGKVETFLTAKLVKILETEHVFCSFYSTD